MSLLQLRRRCESCQSWKAVKLRLACAYIHIRQLFKRIKALIREIKMRTFLQITAKKPLKPQTIVNEK